MMVECLLDTGGGGSDGSGSSGTGVDQSSWIAVVLRC